MRGMGLLIVALVAAGCSFDSGGVSGSIDANANAADAGVDAAIVQCTRDEECSTPPTLCHLAGLCNPSTQRCEFPQKDCSAAADQCNNGTCEAASGACVPTPAHDGDDCNGGTTCDAFGACGGFDPGDSCDESGMRSQDCTDRICSSGSCLDVARVNSEGCSRDQDGVTCQATTCAGFGSCTDFVDTCDENGNRYRACTSYACSSAACVSTSFTDSETCSRSSRDGISCAADSCTGFGACGGFSDSCDESGTRTRTCTPFACSSESCAAGTTFPNVGSCSRDTDGDMCGEVCTLICSGTGDCATVCMGMCSTTCVDVLCSAGTCGP